MGSLGSRIIGTVIAGVCWLTFAVIYLAFFAGSLDFWQKLAVFIASGAIVIGTVAIIWIKWALEW